MVEKYDQEIFCEGYIKKKKKKTFVKTEQFSVLH